MGFDVRKYSEDRKKENEGGSGGFDVARYSLSRAYETDMAGFDERIAKLQSDLQDYLNVQNKYFSTYGDSYQSSAQANAWMNEANKRRESYIADVDEAMTLLNKYESLLDADSANELRYYLRDYRKLANDAYDSFSSNADYWSQFDSETDYRGTLLNRSDDGKSDGQYDRVLERQANLDYLTKRKQELEKQKENLPRPTVIKAGGVVTSDEEIAIDEEIERIDTELNKYKVGNKTHDDYLAKYYGNSDYAVYSNPDNNTAHNITHEGMEKLYQATDSSTWVYDEKTGKMYDQFGVELKADENGNWVHPDASSAVVNDPLGAYMSSFEERPSSTAASAYASGVYAEVLEERNLYDSLGEKGHWEELNENEIGMYYYLLNTAGKDTALQYLEEMGEFVLANRADKTQLEKFNDMGFVGKTIGNVLSVPARVIGGIPAAVEDTYNLIAGNDVNPYSEAHTLSNFADNIRSATAEDFNELTNNAEFLGMTLGGAYQAGMSGADSLLAGAAFGKLGGLVLATGAYSSKAKELYERGASKEQIAHGALAAGLTEMVFESLSLEVFFNKVLKSPTKTVKGILGKTLLQAGVEGSEEFFTEIANTIAEGINMHTQSEWYEIVKKYKEEGLDDGMALGRAVLGEVAKTKGWEAFLGGVIAGGGMGGVGSIASYANTQSAFKESGQNIIKRGGVDALKQLALEKAGVSSKKLDKIQNDQYTGQNAFGKAVAAYKNSKNAKAVGRLSYEVESARAKQNKADIVSALREKGVDTLTAERYADILFEMNEQYHSGEVSSLELGTKQQWKKITGDDAAYSVLREVVTDSESSVNKRNTDYSLGRMGMKITEDGNLAPTVTAKGDLTASEGYTSPVAKAVTEGEFEASADGVTINKDTGEEISIKQIASVSKKGKITFELEDGSTIDAGSVSYASDSEALIYEAVATMANQYGFDTNTANALVNNFKAYNGTDISAKEYALAIDESYRYGRFGYTMDELVKNGKFANKLASVQRESIYNEGNKVRTEISQKEGAKFASEKGEVHIDRTTEKKLSDLQKESLEGVKVIAKVLQKDINVFESYVKGDKRYMKVGGNEVAADNGMYYSKDGAIYIDLFAGADAKGVMMYTLAHELTHHVENVSPAQFKRLADFLNKHYGKKGVSVDEAVHRIMEDSTKGLTYKQAYSEFVAQNMEILLTDGKVAEKLVEMRKTDKGLFNTIKKFFDNLAKRFKAISAEYRDQSHNLTPEGQFIAQSAEAVRELQQIFAEALFSTSENAMSAEETNAVEAFGDDLGTVETNKDGELLLATNEDNSTLVYSERTWKKDGKAKFIKVMQAMGYENAETYAKYLDDTLDYLHELAVMYEKLDQHLDADVTYDIKTDVNGGKQVLSAIVNNGDYPINIDLALICKKRVAYMRLMAKMIEDGMFGDVKYDGDAIAEVNRILRKNGFETACLGCFVESRRLQFQTWAETIVQEWNEAVDAHTEDASYFRFADGKANLTDAEIDTLVQELERGGEKNDKGNLNLGQGSVATKMSRLLDKVPSLAKKLTVDDLLTPQGLTALRSTDGNLFSLVKQRYGAASPKIVQEFNPYNSEIADLSFKSIKDITGNSVKGAKDYISLAKEELGAKPKKQKGESTEEYNARKAEYDARVEVLAMRKYLYEIGGARIQSFSDFMIENVFDYLQIFADLTAKGLPMHGYTKEISALRLFGMTGAKWNGSLIAHVENSMGKEYAGLLPASEAKNGNGILVKVDGKDYCIGFDDYARNKATNGESFIQSIGMKDIVALMYDPRYSPYVGNITIGVSDKQILAMLDSPLFRMVIPYHASGMLPQFAKLVGVDMYNDYTNYQNTTVREIRDLNDNLLTNDEGKPSIIGKNGKEIKIDTHYAFNKKLQEFGDAKKTADDYLAWCEQKHWIYDGDVKVGYATFNPKFSNSPYGTDFTKHENYYKLLEDFNVYDNITEESAQQGAVTMTFPSEENRLTAEQKTSYENALRGTGIFTEAEIKKYLDKADMTFEDIVRAEVGNRVAYETEQEPKWEATVKEVEDTLLKNHSRTASADTAMEYIEGKNKGISLKPKTGSYLAELSDADVQWSERKTNPPTKTIKGYKVFFVKNGKLYPPMVANPNGEGTPRGVWLDADDGELARNKDGSVKTNSFGRPRVKAGGKGTQGGSGDLAYRPGWHLGDLPLAKQFARKDADGNKSLFPEAFVWAECDVAADVEYQAEADAMGYKFSKNGKYNHQQASLDHMPREADGTAGYYRYRTNPDPTTEAWIITGAMKVNRLLTDEEVNAILEENGKTPMPRQGGKLNLAKLGLTEEDFSDDVQYSERKKYSYDYFVGKPDIKIATVGGTVPSNRADIVAVAKRNAAKVGKTNKDGSVSVHVNDIDTDVVLTTHGLRHGLRRKQQMTQANGMVTLMAGEIIQNSIRVNELIPADKEVANTYVLMGIAQDKGGGVYIVRSLVNRYDNELVSMDALYAVNAKKELAVQNAPRLTAKPLSATSSAISIADFLEHVNQYFPDVLSEDVLKHFNHTERPDGDMGENALYSERRKAPTFYSKMGKVVDDIKIDKMGANGVVSYLKGKGVKDEEIKWSGIQAFLDGKKSVTKAELEEFIAGSMLQIGEKTLGLDNEAYMELDSLWREYFYRPLEDSFNAEDGELDGMKIKVELAYLEESEYDMPSQDVQDHMAELADRIGTPTKWHDYITEGGKNYRELLFRIPDSDYTNRAMRVHWGEEGVLAHARIQDFYDADGNKILFIEEIQSDWHNEGHKSGYTSEEYNKAKETFDKLYNEYIAKKQAFNKYVRSGDFRTDPEDVRKKKHDWLRRKMDEAEKRMHDAERDVESLKGNGVGDTPNAPFKENYHEYVLKRLIRMAAEEGYDSIAWTTSDMQMERWNPTRQTNRALGMSDAKNPDAVAFEEGYRIEYDQDIPKFLNKYGKQWGAKVGSTELEGTGEAIYTDENGEHPKTVREWFDDWRESIKFVYGDEVGKRLKVVENGDNNLDLLDTETKEVYTTLQVQNVATKVWSFDITDAMSESVLFEGQPMYSERNNKMSNRAMLANALESVAKNSDEQQILEEYKAVIDEADELESHLTEVNAEIKQLSFGEGTRNNARLRELRADKTKTENRINTIDKKVLRLEANESLRKLLNRERKKAYDKALQQGREAVKRVRDEKNAKLDATIKKYQESRKKAVEGRNKTVMRDKVKKVVKDLNDYLLKGTKEKHVPIGLQKAVAEALDAVNMDTVGAEERVAKYNELIAQATDPIVIESLTSSRDWIKSQGDAVSDKLLMLHSAYEDIKNSQDPDIASAYDEVISNMIEAVKEEVGETSLRNMTLNQLEKVHDMYKAILATIRNANKTFKADKNNSVATVANGVMAEVEDVGGKKDYVVGGKLGKAIDGVKKFAFNNLKPVYAIEKIGSKNLATLFENVRKGEDVWAVDVTEAKEFKEKIVEKYGYDKWDFDKTYTFKTYNGKEYTLSLEQIMSLYAYSKREQALPHLAEGGFVFDRNIETYKEKDGKKSVLKYRVNTASAYRVSAEEVEGIVSNLSTEQRGFVDEMQDYLSTAMGAKGNEVSMAMYDIKLFKEKHYFPLKSAKQYLYEQNEVAGEVRIKNSGFSKGTVKNANNPVILDNFMDVWASHVNDMSMYHAFVLPLEDFNRVFNYKTPSSDSLDTMSVKGVIQDAYGEQANQYISELLKDLNGGARVDSRESFAKAMIGRWKKAKVLGSLSVIIQQPSSIARAFALVDVKYFDLNPRLIKHKKYWAEVKKYAPVAIIKEMGRFDTDMGMSTVDYIKGDKSLMDKVDDALAYLPGWVDEVTWVQIWSAVKREVADKYGHLEGEMYLQKCGERFTEVITKTQVYDSVLSRSANMRSKSVFMNMATSFLAEPTTAINMIEDAIIKASRGDKKAASRQIGAVIASVVLNSLLVSLVYAGRDDDEDETYLEKYVGSFTSNVLDGLNPITNYPILKDAWSILQGFDVERSDMSLISEAVESLNGIVSALATDTEYMTEEELAEHEKGIVDMWIAVGGDLLALCNVAAENIVREVKAVANTIKTFNNGAETTGATMWDEIVGAVKDTTPIWGWLPDESKTNKIYDAIVDGDQATLDRLKSGYKTEESYHTAVRKALRENDPRIREAAEAHMDGDLTERARIAKQIASEGNFSVDDVIAAINAEITKLKKKSGETEEESEEEAKEDEVVSYYKGSDINIALEGGDTSTAKTIIDDLVKTKMANGKTEKEAKASVKSSITSYWKELYLENPSDRGRIRKLLHATGLYGTANDVVKTCKQWEQAEKNK